MATDFLAMIATNVERLAATYGVSLSDAFPIYVGTTMFDLDEDVAFQAAQPGGGNDKGIDLVYVDDDAERVVVMQAKYSPTGTVNTSQSHYLKLMNGVDWLEQLEQIEVEGQAELLASSELFTSAVSDGYRVEIYFVALGTPNETIIRDADVANTRFSRTGLNRRVTVFYRQQFEEFLNALALQRERVPRCSFAIDSDRYFAQEGSYGKAAIFSIAGRELQRLHREHGDLLFARNVRLYLGSRPGGVNAGVRTTLKDEDSRGNFFAFNNGITFVADSFSVSEDGMTLLNASIVNGCQTTVSLSRYLPPDDETVEVLARVIQPPESTIDDVIRFTNSQNQVKIWEIRSQDTVQRRLERDLDQFEPPYLYSTRRGAKTALTSEQKKRYAVADDARTLREVKHDELGQAIAAILGMPKAALKAKSQVFDILYDQIFPRDISAAYVVFVWAAYESAASSYREKVREPDIDSRDLAILKTAGKWYVLAVVGQLLNLRHVGWRTRTKAKSAASSRTHKKLRQYSDAATTLFLQSMKNLVEQQQDLRIGVAVRRDDFFDLVSGEVRKLFDAYRLMPNWIDSALPRIFDAGKADRTRAKKR